ncbi:MAG: hypothetical protein KKH28_15370, partial [Elusimicrobia bacterium]|nr:hypothetical protein [Elusimicrobiota bacterium]
MLYCAAPMAVKVPLDAVMPPEKLADAATTPNVTLTPDGLLSVLAPVMVSAPARCTTSVSVAFNTRSLASPAIALCGILVKS